MPSDFAQAMAESSPRHAAGLTTEIRKEKRKGRIFSTPPERLRADLGPPYAVRPARRPGAPLSWDELMTPPPRPDLHAQEHS
jgi:DNA primase